MVEPLSEFRKTWFPEIIITLLTPQKIQNTLYTCLYLGVLCMISSTRFAVSFFLVQLACDNISAINASSQRKAWAHDKHPHLGQESRMLTLLILKSGLCTLFKHVGVDALIKMLLWDGSDSYRASLMGESTWNGPWLGLVYSNISVPRF